ncbi:hypothetical protein ACH42_06195 [Endozoicomonas sp. (ex Bugula neritina AB1)]|nr:hypothetical protein ACH42_06195 [Endozoicomonas sp. (ex Bugula neritina AB1)]
MGKAGFPDRKFKTDMKREIDIGLLPLLVDLTRYRSLTRVARKHGKTTSAISKSLAKLKLMLDDELFINTSSGLQPTTYVQSMIQPLEKSLREVNESICKNTFDPLVYNQRIVIAANAMIIELYGVKIYKALIEAMPEIRFALLTWDEDTLLAMEKSEVNVGIHVSIPDVGKNIYSRSLIEDRIVLGMRKHHPAKSFQAAMQYPMVISRSKGWNDFRYHIVDEFSRSGYKINQDVVLDQLSTLFQLLLSTDCISLVPKTSLNDHFRFYELPLPSPFLIPVSFYCKTAYRNDPINLLIYELVKQVIV